MKRINLRSVDFMWSDNDSSIEIERKNIHINASRIICSNDWRIIMYNIKQDDKYLYDEIIYKTSDFEVRDIIMKELKNILCKAKKQTII